MFQMNVLISLIQLVYKFILLSEMGQEEVSGGKGLPMKYKEREREWCVHVHAGMRIQIEAASLKWLRQSEFVNAGTISLAVRP